MELKKYWGIDKVKKLGILFNSIFILCLISNCLFSNQLDKFFSKHYIENIKNRNYNFFNISIVNTFEKNKDYEIFNVIYKSEGLKISGLLSKPKNKKPIHPAVLICHGYYPPDTYKQGQGTLLYLQNLAKLGFIVFVPDYRGYGYSDKKSSPLEPGEVYDIINAYYVLLKEKDVDKENVVMLGSSWGGGLGLKALVKISPKFFVDYYGQLGGLQLNENYRKALSAYTDNPADLEDYFQKTSIYYHLDLINTPVYIFHGSEDKVVKPEQSIVLYNLLKKLNKKTELKIFQDLPHAFADNYPNPSTAQLEQMLKDLLK